MLTTDKWVRGEIRDNYTISSVVRDETPLRFKGEVYSTTFLEMYFHEGQSGHILVKRVKNPSLIVL